MSFPFYYSSLNAALCRSNEADTLGFFAAELREKANANAMMHWNPVFNPQICIDFPTFGTYGNQLLDPMLAVQQTLMAFQNNTWQNYNNMAWIPNNLASFMKPNNNVNNNNNNNNTAGGSAGSTAELEYTSLRELIEKYKELNPNLSTDTLGKLNDALNKSGTTEEKLKALKNIYPSLNKTKLQNALLSLPENKVTLSSIGYNFDGLNKKDDTSLKKDLNTLATSIKSTKSDSLTLVFSSKTDAEILRKISYWNDSHNTDEERSVIRMIANNLPTSASELTHHKTGVENIATSLINRVEDFKADANGEYPKLDSAKEEVEKALANALKDFKKETLMTLAKKFENLYGQLRNLEAQKARNSLIAKYEFLNKISTTDTDFINDDLLVKATETDLSNEGIIVSETDEVPVEEPEHIDDVDDGIDASEDKPEDKLKQLNDKKHIKPSKMKGVYQSYNTSTNEYPKFYMVSEGKLIELKGVRAIDQNGTCSMKAGGTKNLKDVIKESTEVTAAEITTYNNTLKNIDTLVSEGKIKKWNKRDKYGNFIYHSTGVKEDGHYQNFMLRNNKLMQINCISVDKGYVAIFDKSNPNKNKSIDDLTDSDFKDVGTIVTENLKAKADQKKAEEARKKREEEIQKEKNKFDRIRETEPPEDKIAENNGESLYNDLTSFHVNGWFDWGSSDDDWDSASNRILGITAKNVYHVIKGYAANEGICSDNILEQIATESGNGRTSAKKKQLIDHIIKQVLAFLDENGSCDSSEYKRLDKYRKNGVSTQAIESEASTTIRSIDHMILHTLGLDK